MTWPFIAMEITRDIQNYSYNTQAKISMDVETNQAAFFLFCDTKVARYTDTSLREAAERE